MSIESLAKEYKEYLDKGIKITLLGKFRNKLTDEGGIPGTSAQYLGELIKKRAAKKEVLDYIEKDKKISEDTKNAFRKVLK